MPLTALDHTLELLACAVGRRGAEQSFARLDRKAGRLLGAPLYGAGRRCHLPTRTASISKREDIPCQRRT